MKRLANTWVARSLAFLLALLATAGAAHAQGPIASGTLKIQGNRLSLYADELTTDADQTVNVGERARVRTCFGSVDAACGSVPPGDPRVAGLLVRGELRGPEVPQSILLETVPGGTFVLPGFQQEGDYRLENIRLVDAGSGQVLATAEPSLAILHVREILLASATVRTLSLAELQARGITLTAENFQAFSFAVGFAFGDEIVEIELPMVYTGYGTVQPLDKPTVTLDGLPEDVAHAVARWQPPHIVPFKLEVEEGQALRAGEEEDEALRLPLFGAIVLPGNVSYLNQFFEARLVVANGAPGGSDARLGQVQAILRLPPSRALRVAASDPSVAPGQAVPVVKPGGGRSLFPGEQGTAAWTVEGLIAGTHTLQMDITADLERPGRDPFPLLSRIQAAVEVVDARFNLTFSHPDVVREGEGYSLFVTVTNLSRAAQNLITVELERDRITGAHPLDSQDTLRRSIETLAPGQSETLEYRLVADLDGKVVATTFQSTSSAGQGTIRLRTGVGELGIPLSPASLILPRFSERLKTPYLGSDDLHRAHTRFLGLAYSLAVAPAALTPSGLPRVIKTDVERRAVDFAQAGQRTWLGEGLLESLEVLTLDALGNRHPLQEIDELRRATAKGLAVGTELARALRDQQEERNLGAEALFDHFATTTTYTAPYAAALLVPDSADGALTLEVRGTSDGTPGRVSGEAGTAGAVRTLPFGEIFPLRREPLVEETVPFAVVGYVEPDQVLDVVVRNPGSQDETGRLVILVPDPDGSEDRRIEISGLTVPAGRAVVVRVGGQIASPAVVDAATGAPAGGSPSIQEVERPPFRLIGAVQDFRMKEDGPDVFGNMIRPNRYGNGVVYLFNRPPTPESAEVAETYRIRSRFQGLDTAGQPASGTSEKVGTGAWMQDDGRTVTVRYATPLSALTTANSKPLLAHEHLLETRDLVDLWGERLDPVLPPPTLETAPLHVGGLVSGRVLRGTGEPVAGAKVQLIRPIYWETQADTVVKLDFLGEVTTGADGVFFFDFVETPHWDKQVLPRFTLRAVIPAGSNPALEPEEIQEVSSTVRLQNRMMRINIALLGRGTVRGRLLYADTGEAVSDGTVRATSTLFNEEKAVPVAADGSFVVPGVPVGPITLTGRDGDGRVVYATIGISKPGDSQEVVLLLPRLIPGLGIVAGTVVGATSGEAIPGARVTVYSKGAALSSQETDDFGRFRFDQVPEGQVSLQAANWAVSRMSVFTDLLLAANETREVALRLPEGASRTVTGQVFFHDPVTNTNVPVQGAVAFIEGPGVFAYTDAAGRYRIEGVPVQGANERYSLKAIDFNRKLEGRVELPPILDATAEVVEAQSIVLQQMSGGLDGVVLDPLGRPVGGVEVAVYPYGTATSGPDGGFTFRELPIGSHTVVAHKGDGLQPGQVGYFGDATAQIAYGGHRPFVAVRMRGAGIVNILTKTGTATGVLTPIYYKPTYYSSVEYSIRLKGSYIETSTDPNGNLQLTLPVGRYELIAYNPFHGMHTIQGEIGYAGQVVDHKIVFQDAATVTGQVVGVDGVTPVPNVEVILDATGLQGQKQRSDPQGRFRFELVPKGRVVVTAQGLAGSVERAGRTLGYVGTAGQTLDLVVQMKAQGTVAGRVMERFNGELRPLAQASYFLQENSFPFRRLPAEGWLVTDGEGRYQVPRVSSGSVTVVARDSGQVGRYGSQRADLTFDWQVLQMPDIVMTTSVGSLRITVRHPVTGGPVADAQVRLPNNEATVTGPDGVAFFDALPLGTYEVTAFYAPTGQSGRLSGVRLTSAGQQMARTIYLDQRGEVRGTLWDDAAKTIPRAGGIVRLEGTSAGGRVTALATTSGVAGSEGRFELLGIPEGTFNLEAALPTSPRRAYAVAALTATAPIIDLHLILEPGADRYFQLHESRRTGIAPVVLSGGLFSLRLTQPGYDYAQLAPVAGTDRFLFPNALLSRQGEILAEELTGERRTGWARFGSLTGSLPFTGAGTQADPFRLVLSPKGAVRVAVRDALGRPVQGANVTLNTSGGGFPSVTGADGNATFAAVPAGGLAATATSLANGTSGYSTATLLYDDDLVEMTVGLAPAVAAHGLIYLPVPDDRPADSPALLVPAAGVIVEIRDSRGNRQVVMTDEAGSYRFAALSTGGYQLAARNQNGDQFASRQGSLVGPDGQINEIPPLVLDAGPPRLLGISPPPGLEGVSLTAAVELLFSEALDPAVLPADAANPAAYFSLKSDSGEWVEGRWTSSLDGSGHQLVRFVPSRQYQSLTVYSLAVIGGTGGVRDRVGRPLTSSGNVGSTFKTSDRSGPAVIGTDPDLARPVDPRVPVRIDFNEALAATDEQLDGDLAGDAAELAWEHESGEWRRLPVTLYLTRSNYSLAIQPVQGVSLTGDTRRRRLIVSGLEDPHGNLMSSYNREFRLWDARAPVIDAVPFPQGAAEGQLLQGEKYVLTPLLGQLDDVTAQRPGGDVARVDYFFEDPSDPARPVSPAYSTQSFPFSYSFVASYVGDGVAPRPFPVWVRAVDTSTNQSNVVRVSLVVLPNTEPRIEAVSLTATRPVPGAAYAGSTLLATVSGFYDLDGSNLTLFTELWEEGAAAALTTTDGRPIIRPDSGWNDAAAETFTFELPIGIEEGARLFLRARVLDTDGAAGEAESERIRVNDDTSPPVIGGFSARLAGAPVTQLFIGEELYLELRAHDAETGIESIVLELDRTDLFPGPLTATRVAGTDDLYRTAAYTVPTGVKSVIPVTATARASDFGGNVADSSLQFNLGPERDPNAPVARWRSPWPGALWPAEHTSDVSDDGTALLLRLYARDTNSDIDGNPVPGKLVSVEVRGPQRNAESGHLELAAAWLKAEKVPGTEDISGAVYQAMWRVPNSIPAGTEVPFEARVIDSAGTESVVRMTMTAVAAHNVYEEGTASVRPEETLLGPGGNPDGPVFLLDKATVSVMPPADGSIRRLPGLFLYSGASVENGVLTARPSILTAPEINSYNSTVPYYPLELAIDSELGVAAESRIEMDRRGLMGSTSVDSMALPGETISQQRAGGSHGGLGWVGSLRGGWTSDLFQPGSVYDSLRDPHLPGGGGGSSDRTAKGGAGGGVIRLMADGARVRLDGSITADGGNGTGDHGGGGAGGAVRLTAARLEGNGRILARGGHGTRNNTTGGGGGGRISVSYQELGLGFDVAAQVDASGGLSHAGTAAETDGRGGAGTIHLETIALQPGPQGPGKLLLKNPATPSRPALTPLPALGTGAVSSVTPEAGTVVLDVPAVRGDVVGDRVALAAADGSPLGSFVVEALVKTGGRVALTLAAAAEELAPAADALAGGGTVSFHGISRLLSVEAVGAVRLVSDDDLLLGPEGSAELNDRGAILLRPGSRALLRGEGPVVTFLTQPVPGTGVLLGSSVRVEWTVEDPLGMSETRVEQTIGSAPQPKPYNDEPLTVKSEAAATLAIPISTTASGVTYTVEARNQAGRVTRSAAVWPILANAPPTGQISLAAGTTTPVRAGTSISIKVQFADREGLARVTLQTGGPATPVTQSINVSGTAGERSFTVQVASTADGTQPVILQALVEDASGGSTLLGPLSVPVVNDNPPAGVPRVTLTLNPDRGTGVYRPGEVVMVRASAIDDGAVTALALIVDGASTASAGAPVELAWTVPGVTGRTALILQATATDDQGKQATVTRIVTAEPQPADAPPTLAVLCPATGALFPDDYGLSLKAAAADDLGVAAVRFFLEDAAAPFAEVAVTGKQPTASALFNLAQVTGPTARFRVEAVDTTGQVASQTVEVQLVSVVDLKADGQGTNDWTALADKVVALRGGTLTLDRTVTLGGLLVLGGAKIAHPATPAGGSARSIDLTVNGPLYVACEGSIDVSARGYQNSQTYPGHAGQVSGAGSHMGQGGVYVNGTPGETFGSVYFPRENGGGGAKPGGGAVRIAAQRVQVDGAIRANGADSYEPPGAGGSVWILAETLAGSGIVEARGGDSGFWAHGTGGGGAIAIDYDSLAPGATILDRVRAGAGPNNIRGAAGTVYLRDGNAVHGDLIVDNGTIESDLRTLLPALGLGTAQQGSVGAVLVTGKAQAIPAYFVGHWVEVRDGVTGSLEGTWRVESIGLDGRTLVLAANEGQVATVDTGDSWQGVYRFDRLVVRGKAQPESADPIRVTGDQVIAGSVETSAIYAGRLVVEPGAVLTQRATTAAAAPQGLRIEVGELVIKAGGAIDVSKRGYRGMTFPGHVQANDGGGSHLGQGGTYIGTPGEPFGSVYFPQENGGGSGTAAGGAVRIVAGRVQLDGAIRANGELGFAQAGAGGSVWITTEALAGSGLVEAKGGGSSHPWSGAGGGGAIAIDYSSLEAGSTLLGHLTAQGGVSNFSGGAGTIYLHDGQATYGDLIVDNGSITDKRRTILPSLGRGTAQAGSAGALLVTGRVRAIPAYFVGHWVEVRDGSTGSLKGTWRVGSVGSGGSLSLLSNAGEPVAVVAGDTWQGIYRFDHYTVNGQIDVVSPDPIHVFSEQVITGIVETDSVIAESLVVRSGAVLRQRVTTSAAAPESLRIQVGELVVETGGLIDVSARGYEKRTTYPGHLASVDAGGSHLGEAGAYSTGKAGDTFGSLYFPRENGAGGHEGRGAGAVRIIAGSIQMNGAIRANGEHHTHAGAGGSVWITAGTLDGNGTIEARGGSATAWFGGAGGGGAVAIEYTSLAPASSLLDRLNVSGGSPGTAAGGAGTIYLRGPGATLGRLIVSNPSVPVSEKRRTVLPSLGRGMVQPGSSGGTIVTGRAADVPGHFVGHWVEIEGPDRVVKGIWRIAAVRGTEVTLEPKPGQPFTIAPGDRWRGIYRFDQVTVTSSALLVSLDPVIQIVQPLPEGARRSGPSSVTAAVYDGLYGNEEAPDWNRAAVSIAVGTVSGSYRITLAPGAAADPDGIAEVLLTSGGRSLSTPWLAEGVSLLWSGTPGQRLHLVAVDAHGRFRRSSWLELPPLPDGGWGAQLELAAGVTPVAVAGGPEWLALADDGVWLYGTAPQPIGFVPPRSADEEVVALVAAGPLLLSATQSRIDLLDRTAQTLREVPVGEMKVVDVVATDGEAVVLLVDRSDPEQPVFRLSQMDLSSEAPPALSLPGELALPVLTAPALHRTNGFLHLLGLREDGQGVIYSWAAAPGEPLTSQPDSWESPVGWRAAGPWERGAVLLEGNAVLLVEHGASGWIEVSRIELPVEALSVAVAGDVLTVVVPGEIVLYDVSDPAAPALLSHHPGSSHREVEPLPDGQVLLWSPRMTAPPLRWDPVSAVPGQGFQTVIPALP